MYDPKKFKAPKMSPVEKYFSDRGLRVVIHAVKAGAENAGIRFHVEKIEGGVVELEPNPMPGEMPKAYLKRIGVL